GHRCRRILPSSTRCRSAGSTVTLMLFQYRMAKMLWHSGHLILVLAGKLIFRSGATFSLHYDSTKVCFRNFGSYQGGTLDKTKARVLRYQRCASRASRMPGQIGCRKSEAIRLKEHTIATFNVSFLK